jgi:IS30 family transposase
MDRPGPITEAEQQQIRKLHAAGLGRNDIAKSLGRSQGTISKWCSRLGLEFCRLATQAATAAKVTDAKARRAALAEALLDDIERLRHRAWSKYTIVGNSIDGPVKHTLDLPPLREVSDAYKAVETCARQHLAIAKHDSDTGVDEGKSMLAALGTALGQAYQQMTDADQS